MPKKQKKPLPPRLSGGPHKDLSWEDFHKLGDYIREVANLLSLRDWTFNVEYEPCDPKAGGEIDITYGRKLADIKLPRDIRTRQRSRNRHSIVHELIHCHFEHGAILIRQMEKQIGQMAHAPLWEGYAQALELGVDALAESLAVFMPDCPVGAPDRDYATERASH